ncbi:SO2930 family diheme c-type cytochrome [Dokdonella ginsengisoli]|uniref:SO2930 family diheme c-type cytochrome n=1 Tax=Dokdonella ginsengisoli TaxID=363846 RepID=A0ABV9QW75_9GAMM
MTLFAAVSFAALLAGCARAPQPVHFFAEGKPPRLSDWHLVEARDGRLAPNADVVPYDLNTPLFSDYAHKFRTVWMPKGAPAKYDAEGPFDFPVGTVLSKTFYYPRAANEARASKAVARTYDTADDFAAGSGNAALDLSKVRLIETRLLVRREQGWEAIPYVWNAAQTEAELARTGDAIPLELVDDQNQHEGFTYVVPNENQCAGCHVANVKAKRLEPLGPKARHLNREYAYADGKREQLASWSEKGYLSGVPAADVPRDADWHDPAQPLDTRARAYLDVNCSQCHSPTGPANTTALDLRSAATDLRRLGVCKPPVAAGRGTGDRLLDIVPGKPDESILLYRMLSDEPGVMMPEMGRDTTHREGVDLIRQWIAAMPGSCGA